MAHEFRFTPYIYTFTLALQLFMVFTTASAQKESKPKKDILEIGLGLNTQGPTRQMVNLMKDYNLDGSHMSFFSDNKTYPRFYWFGMEFHMAYFRKIAEQSRVGVAFSSQERGTVKGYSNATHGMLDVRFSQASIALLYRYQVQKQFEFEAGPAIAFNNATTDSREDKIQDYMTISPALKCGINLLIYEREKSNLKTNLSYIYSGLQTMGPFTDNGNQAPITIPKHKFSFSFVSMGLTYGLSR